MAKKKNAIIGVVGALVVLAIAVTALGCRKEEPKVYDFSADFSHPLQRMATFSEILFCIRLHGGSIIY